MGKYIFKVFIPAISLLLLLPSLSSAQSYFPTLDTFTKGTGKLEPGKMRIGRVEFHPGFSFESRYESNIFDDADRTFQTLAESPTDDFVFTNKPSMGIELKRAPGELFGFSLDYLGEDEHFLNEGDQNTFNHRFGGAINLGGPGGRGDLTIGGTYADRAGGGSRDFDSNIGNRQQRRSTTGYLDLIYSLTEIFKLQLRGDVENDKLQANDDENVTEYNTGGTLFWQATKQAAFGVKYNHRARRYAIVSVNNDDSDADQVFLVLKWQPTSLFSGDFAVGYDNKRLDRFKGEDSQHLVYNMDLLYKPVQRTGITFRAAREVVDSTFRGIQSYILSDVQVGVAQDLGKKLQVLVDASLEHRDYRRSALDTANGGVRTRIDDNIIGSTALVYKIQKWLNAQVKYQYEENISNFDAADFVNHIGLFEISAKY